MSNSWVVKSATSDVKISTLTTSRTSKSNWIKASIAFGFYFCDYDPVTRLMLSNK